MSTIFDRRARRLRRDRAQPDFAEHDFLRAAMLDGLAERLDAVTRPFHDILDLGCFDGGFLPPPGRGWRGWTPASPLPAPRGACRATRTACPSPIAVSTWW
ncbi:hypothetical protein GCM10020258_27900 [Sphingomonas yabuuchiae]